MMASAPVADDQITLFEAGGRPRVEQLGSRLDVIYRADGHTVIETVPLDPGGTFTSISFPSWWVGPIWVTLTAAQPHATGQVTLRWPPWEKHLRVPSGATVTARKAQGEWPALYVHSPPGWTVTAGVGAHPDAADVNQDWHPIDQPSASTIFNDYHPVSLRLFAKTPAQLVDLLRRHSHRP